MGGSDEYPPAQDNDGLCWIHFENAVASTSNPGSFQCYALTTTSEGWVYQSLPDVADPLDDYTELYSMYAQDQSTPGHCARGDGSWPYTVVPSDFTAGGNIYCHLFVQTTDASRCAEICTQLGDCRSFSLST